MNSSAARYWAVHYLNMGLKQYWQVRGFIGRVATYWFIINSLKWLTNPEVLCLLVEAEVYP